jgi:6-phospho-3-hexuloisomerase
MEIKEIIKELEVSSNQVNEEQINELINLVEKHKRIFVYATGRSGLMVKAFAMRLMQLDYISYVIGETTTPSLQRGDLLIVASASGETESVCNAVDNAKENGINTAIITTSNTSYLTKKYVPTIIIDSATKFSTSNISIQPLGSLFEQMLLIVLDSIILKMTQRDKNSNSDMAHRHASIE